MRDSWVKNIDRSARSDRRRVALALAVGALAAQSQVHHPGHGVSLPAVITEVKADYTAEAKAAGIQGSVGLDTVVLADDVAVAQSRCGSRLDRRRSRR